MSQSFDREEARGVVPRWRTSERAIRSGEVLPLPASKPSMKEQERQARRDDAFFRRALAEWQAHRRIGFAHDLLSAAYTLGRPQDALDAATFILDNPVQSAPQAVELAQLVLSAGHDSELRPASEISSQSLKAETRASIHNLKRRLVEYPRNPIAWVDLARQYTLLGLFTKAERCMRHALALAPDHRFVLRAAARLYIHIDDPNYALKLIRNQSLSREDPWMQAAEIATARIAGKPPRFVRTGRAFIERGRFSPFHTSELAAAIATSEFENGSDKAARKQFAHALIEPTENTVAQAEWASRRHLAVGLQPHHFEVPSAFEAQAWEQYLEGDWCAAITACISWLKDEPYSARPVSFGSHIAAVGLDDHKLSAAFTEWGLVANPKDPTFLNNAAFELASMDEPLAARKALLKIDLDAVTDRHTRIVLAATVGLIEYRSGNPVGGKLGYEAAIKAARHDKLQELEATALLYHIRERVRLGEQDVLDDLSRAEKLNDALAARSLSTLLARTKNLVEDLPTSTSPGQ